MKFLKNLKSWWKGQDISEAKKGLSKAASSLGVKAVIFGAIALVTPPEFVAEVVGKSLGTDVIPVFSLTNAWVSVLLMLTGLFLLVVSFVLGTTPKSKAATATLAVTPASTAKKRAVKKSR